MGAVVGQEFDLAVLSAMGPFDHERAIDLLDDAVSAGVLREDAHVVGRYRFSHGLVRETVYGDLGGTRRARMHGKVADALEAMHRSPDDDTAIVERAHHSFQA